MLFNSSVVVENNQKLKQMEHAYDLSSSLSFASSSYVSNGSSYHNVPASPPEPGLNLEFLSLSKLSGSLEKLLEDVEYDYSDALIEVEGMEVGVHRCILAARSPFFHDLFKKKDHICMKEGKPKYLMSDLVPNGWVGYEAFKVVLNYFYTGKMKPSPTEVSTCVGDSCAHDACGPSIHYATQLMYASSTFQMKELVMLVQRRLLNFVDKALPEDVIPILVTASHCQLNHLLLHCVQRVARSDLDDVCLEKELPSEVLGDIRSLRNKLAEENEACTTVVDSTNEKRVRSLLKALDCDDIELVTLLLGESTISLDDACALHYAAAYCDPKVVSELLNLGTVDLNRRNSRGYTVLHVAARRKDTSILLELLRKGARVTDTTLDGQTAITICRRLTRPKDYYKKTNRGEESHKDRLCIDVLEREMRRNPMAGNISISETVGAESDLLMRLMWYEDRVAHARLLFPAEAKLAMDLARAYSTSEFEGSLASQESSEQFKKVNLNENPSEKTQRLLKRLEALQKTVENGRHFFPHCSEVLDKILDDDMPDGFFLERGTDQERTLKKRRFKELKHDVMRAFDKDKAEKNWAGLAPESPPSSALSKGVRNPKFKKR